MSLILMTLLIIFTLFLIFSVIALSISLPNTEKIDMLKNQNLIFTQLPYINEILMLGNYSNEILIILYIVLAILIIGTIFITLKGKTKK